jgi:hypothetical protein
LARRLKKEKAFPSEGKALFLLQFYLFNGNGYDEM